jgi:lycopene beta-cyclase
VDLAILGGGLAGLSVAAELARFPDRATRRVLLVESRERYVRDRTWCFWDAFENPFKGVVQHEWRRWEVRSSGSSVVTAPGLYRYQHLPGDVFYREALRRIGADREIEVWTGTTAHDVRADRHGVRVETSRGPVLAGRVLDSRPRRPAPASKLQHFVGWCVETEASTFSVDTVTLMDFEVDQEHGIHFMYVLPFSATRALVEATFLGPEILPASVYSSSLRGYLRRRYGVDRFEIRWRESGAIPMASSRAVRSGHPRVDFIGTAGGAVKPSTGYAFPFVQRFARRFAARLCQSRAGEVPRPHARFTGFLDRVFLNDLRRHPREAPSVFLQLFRAAPADAVVRFLSECGGWSDHLAVMRAMPKLRFGLEALRTLPQVIR